MYGLLSSECNFVDGKVVFSMLSATDVLLVFIVADMFPFRSFPKETTGDT